MFFLRSITSLLNIELYQNVKTETRDYYLTRMSPFSSSPGSMVMQMLVWLSPCTLLKRTETFRYNVTQSNVILIWSIPTLLCKMTNAHL